MTSAREAGNKARAGMNGLRARAADNNRIHFGQGAAAGAGLPAFSSYQQDQLIDYFNNKTAGKFTQEEIDWMRAQIKGEFPPFVNTRTLAHKIRNDPDLDFNTRGLLADKIEASGGHGSIFGVIEASNIAFGTGLSGVHTIVPDTRYDDPDYRVKRPSPADSLEDKKGHIDVCTPNEVVIMDNGMLGICIGPGQ